MAIAAAIAEGLYGRLWLIFHAPYPSDPSIVGLIAQGGLHGHFTAFYGGQVYGGTAEDYIVALAFAVFGQTGVVAELVVTALTALAAAVTYCIARHFVSRRLALLAGALTWAAPAVAVRDSTRVTGFRAVTLVCGLGILLLALLIGEGKRPATNLCLLGFLLGIGWWSSPEIAYFALPAALVVGNTILRRGNLRKWLLGVGGAILFAFVGSLPWIWANVQSGLASIRPVPNSNIGYLGRLSIFFRYSLPMETGLLRADDGARILKSMYWPAFGLMVATIVVMLGFCVIQGGSARAIAVALLAFPLLYAIAPTSWAWQDGRYAWYLVPLLALILVIGSSEAARRLHMGDVAPALAMVGVLICSIILAGVGLFEVVHLERATFTSHWGNPDDPTLQAISQLERAGVTTGYADYWVAYRLDFLSRGNLNITTAGADNDRSPTINEDVARSRDPAWLFVPPSEAWRDGDQFLAPWLSIGPDAGDITEGRFTTALLRLGIRYRTVDTGILVAIVPDAAVRPYQIGAPGAAPPRS